jgi:hypothetical protein
MIWNIRIIAVIVLILHGIIHLMGTTVYMKLGEIQGFTYKTTLLSGHWDLDSNGISIKHILTTSSCSLDMLRL